VLRRNHPQGILFSPDAGAAGMRGTVPGFRVEIALEADPDAPAYLKAMMV
jgi:hypothetical protein